MYVPGNERQPQSHKGSSSELGLLACASLAPRLEARLFPFPFLYPFTPQVLFLERVDSCCGAKGVRGGGRVQWWRCPGRGDGLFLLLLKWTFVASPTHVLGTT